MNYDKNYATNEFAATTENYASKEIKGFNHKNENIDVSRYKLSNNILTSPKYSGCDCFEPISNPNQSYQDSTTKIDISNLIDGTIYPSITNGVQTANFSPSVQKLTVPSSWATWSSPPQSENATPPVLASGTSLSLIINLSKPSTVFGFELEPNPFAVFDYTVNFYSGTILVGSITQSVDGYYGAKLFAAKTCCSSPFDRIEISGGADFAIAQIRYNDGSCNCCCTKSVEADFKSCTDTLTVPVEVTNLSCEGKLLKVDVTVTACELRKVAVGVLVCDKSEEKVLRFKVCEGCMPKSTDPNNPCVTSTFKFCFIFDNNSCSANSFVVKTIAEYACFESLPCC